MCDLRWSDPWGAVSPTDVRESFQQAQIRPGVRRLETVQAGSVRFAQTIERNEAGSGYNLSSKDASYSVNNLAIICSARNPSGLEG